MWLKKAVSSQTEVNSSKLMSNNLQLLLNLQPFGVDCQKTPITVLLWVWLAA
jgi:hypothetical protein